MPFTEPKSEIVNLESLSLKTSETERADELIRRLTKLHNYSNLTNSIATEAPRQKLAQEMTELAESVPENKDPKTPQEVVSAEMRRRLNAEAQILLSRISPEVETWQEIIGSLGIPEQDLDNVGIWLTDNLEKVRETNDRLLEGAENLTPRLTVDLGIEELRMRAQYVVERHLDVLKDVLRKDFSSLPGVTQFLDRYLIASNVKYSGAYVNWQAYILSVGVESCTQIYQNEVSVIPEDLIAIVGHEGLGHCANFMTTEAAVFLPEFLRSRTGPATEATAESVAKYFERKFFDFLKFHPIAVKRLEFQEDFDKIYHRYKETQLLEDYWYNLKHYGRLTLAKNGKPDVRNGKPQNETSRATMEELVKYSLDPKFPIWFLKNRENDWDQSTGRLLRDEVAQLRYCTKSAQRIMTGLTGDRVPLAEKLILTGAWTPEGLEQWVRVNLH